jgi:nucleoside-diphosphate-sugar epimerase
MDVRDNEGIVSLFARHAANIELIVHTAAQPSHDRAASDPQTDFTVNANGTLNLLQAARDHAPDATFIFTSTNKVYGAAEGTIPTCPWSRQSCYVKRSPGASWTTPLRTKPSRRPPLVDQRPGGRQG